MIHIEGMGWMGAALAWRLHHGGLTFTWSDSEAPHTAWRACTGIVYPAGDTQSQANLAGWANLLAQQVMPAGTVVPVRYCFAHKKPPHGGRYPLIADLGWLRIGHAPCFAVDVSAIVAAARSTFAARRTDTPPAGAAVIVAHGHTARRAGWVWGWSAPVRLELPADLVQTADTATHVALYGRVHRFAITYAYPIPTRPGWWWAGSALINQSTPRELDTAREVARWLGDARTLYPPIRVADVGQAVPGWRPKPHPDDPGTVQEDDRGRLVFPPLWHSGVRWAPTLLEAAAAWAGKRADE